MPSSSVIQCDFCQFDVPISSDRCPHCARPSLFPNVTQAIDRVQMSALETRYQAALQKVPEDIATTAQKFEDAVSSQSEAVVTRYSTELFRLATSEDELYASFYGQLQAGARTPSEGFWDGVREVVDSKLFGFYKNHIRFAALALNRRGFCHYGDCFVTLRDDMIAHRSTVFEENSVMFMHQRNLGITSALPDGFMAPWQNRGRLALAKYAGALSAEMVASDFPAVLASEGVNAEEDAFIEVHIYGPLSIRTVADVSVHAGSTDIRQEALQIKLTNFGITLKFH